jgi:hypothetical protein
LCNRSRWWPSKSGYFVCYVCHPCPLQALTILARGASVGAIRRAEAWAQVEAQRAVNAHDERAHVR